MGFTLGRKEVLINTDTDHDKVNFASGAYGTLQVKGYGLFRANHIESIQGFRYTEGVDAQGAFKINDADHFLKGRASGVISVVIRLLSDRHEAEFANEKVFRGPTFTFMVDIKAGQNNQVVGKRVIDTINAYEVAFGAELPFIAGAGGSGGTHPENVYITMKPGFTYLDIGAYAEVDSKWLKTSTRYPYSIARTRAVQPKYTGAYLEENVRMSLPHTSDLYAIEADQLPKLSGKYSTILITARDDQTGGIDSKSKMHKGLGGTRDEDAGKRFHQYIIYFDETGDEIIAHSMNEVALFAEYGTNFAGNFYKADGTVAATIAEWLA